MFYVSIEVVYWVSIDLDYYVVDIERVWEYLGIDWWIVFGILWGLVFGIVYVECYFGRVWVVVLVVLSTSTRADIEWFIVYVGCFFLVEWWVLRDYVFVELGDLCLVDVYWMFLMDDDFGVWEVAAQVWCCWEDVYVVMMLGSVFNLCYDDARFCLGFVC